MARPREKRSRNVERSSYWNQSRGSAAVAAFCVLHISFAADVYNGLFRRVVMEELSGRPKIAYLILAAAGLDIAARCCHWLYVDGLRQQYLAGRGSIDIPESMYFAGLLMNVQVPLLLLFLILQYASAVAFVCNCRGIGGWTITGFWCAWLTAWPVCIFSPLLLAS